jgi:dTDP-4-dehydrorhamnose 3,5-epimerase
VGAVKLIQARRFGDERGWFSETWNAAKFAALGLPSDWVQDNHSLSRPRFVLRGLHFQTPPHAQAKLVRCLKGRIWDIAVDVRAASPTFGRWVAAELTEDNARQLFIPEGFAHAFLTLETDCEVAYKVTGAYAPECDGGLRWSDPTLAIPWPLEGSHPVLSDKDARLPRLADFASPFDYDGEPLEELSEPLTP